MSITMIIRRRVIVGSEYGLHLRTAQRVAEAAQKFSSSLTIEGRQSRANAKSILELLILGAGQGASLELQAEGNDAELAIQDVASVIEESLEFRRPTSAAT